jgi:hypothetical protein
MLQCCNLADLCVGYSFNAVMLGSISGITGTAVTVGGFGTAGMPCGTGETYRTNTNILEGCTLFVFSSRLRSMITDGTGTLTAAPCVLLSNISQLIPSNGWGGGIKLSALQQQLTGGGRRRETPHLPWHPLCRHCHAVVHPIVQCCCYRYTLPGHG